MTGLMSINGVLSNTSRFDTVIVSFLMSRIVVSCRPIGFGRSGDLVAKTPNVRALGLFRGLVDKTLLAPLSSHVNNMILDPAVNPSIACSYPFLMINAACGAPSLSCNGHSFRSFSDDLT